MRIWIIHQHAISPQQSGPTRHYDIARELIARGHEVFIVASNYCHNHFHYLGAPYSKTHVPHYFDKVPFIWLAAPSYKKNSWRRLWNMSVFAYRVSRLKKSRLLPKPDMIIGSSPSPFSAWAAYRLAKHWQIPFIYEIRDLWPQTLLDLGKLHRYHPLVILLAKIERQLLLQSVMVISVLPGAKDYVMAKKITKREMLWLPNFADLRQINYRPPVASPFIRILYAGSFNLANDVGTLIQAAKILQSKQSAPYLIQLIGEGPLKAKLMKQVKDEQIRHIEFLSGVAKQDIYSVLNQADVLIGLLKSTPLYQWGTSLNKISDYLAVGRPIIFALDSPYDPISQANAGMTIAPENPEQLAQAITTLMSLPPSQREQLGLNGHRYARNCLNLPVLVDQLCKALEGIHF